ncbi:MAG TPA: sulfatase-like hydrolase/transferase [Firmicutes bacterium]|jgi:arylsulfatase A-like enzyme|nr:sulfatase-like hydrolase/transferase [Bacillota bacterium]
MKRLGRLWLLCLCLLLFTSASATAALVVPFDPAPKLIIMIMLDGFRPDYITMYGPPHLQRLVLEGAWVAKASAVFPSMTTSNQTSFVTGALPANTGIPNNSRYDRQQDRIITPLRDNHRSTIAEMLVRQGWYTASVNHFMLQNRGVYRYVQGDMTDVINLIQTDRPTLIVYYNAQIDTVGHQYGPFHTATRQAVLEADAEIGRLLQELERLGIAEQTAVVVASDHGMSPHDGVPITPDLTQLMYSGLKLAADNASIKPDTELVYIASGAVYLYWRNGMKTPEREAKLQEILAGIDGADIYWPEDMAAVGADWERLGDVAIVPQSGRSLRRLSGGGGHGTPDEMHTLMLFWGSGIKQGAIVHRASIIDIVPTLLALIRADIPETVDGKVLTEILDRAGWKERLGVAGSYVVRDVAASGMTPISLASYVADGSVFTAWEGPFQDSEAYIELDLGVSRSIGAIELVAALGETPWGPRECAVEVSTDGITYQPAFKGELPPIIDTDAVRLDLEQEVMARYVRLTAWSGWQEHAIKVAELRVWAGDN